MIAQRSRKKQRFPSLAFGHRAGGLRQSYGRRRHSTRSSMKRAGMGMITKFASFVSHHLKALHARWPLFRSSARPPKQVNPILARWLSTLMLHFAEYTPLRVAIHRRHWSTVKTILTIAAAQQRTKAEATTTRPTFSTLDIKLGPVVPFFLL